jgi:hypothetical protein
MSINEIPPSVLLFDEFESPEMIEARREINLAILQILSAGLSSNSNSNNKTQQ